LLSKTSPVDSATASSLYADAQAAVRAYAAGASIDAAAAAAFGADISGAAVAAAVRAFDRYGWARLELVDEVLHGARGAYDRQSDTIYLSRQYASDTSAAGVVGVIVEEIGHAIDARVNESDAAGDEGAIFAQFVLGQAPSAPELALLHAENDHGTINVDGNAVQVEFSSTSNGAKVGIVYSESTAARYWNLMAYSQLFMTAQSQATMAGVPYDILTEADLKNAATLQQYDALIFPSFVNVKAADVAAITSALTQASHAGVGLIASGDFMTNNATGGNLADPYARMHSLFGLEGQAWGTGAITVKAGNISDPMMADYSAGEVIHTYTNEFYGAYTGFGSVVPTQLVQQTIGSQTYNAVVATTISGTRNVHFSSDAMMADNNLLWQAIDTVVNGAAVSEVTAGLQLSRGSSIVASRVDMDQAMFPSDVTPGDRPGIYDVLLPILQTWKNDYNFVGSYYIDIGNDAPNETTNWAISGEYYRRLLALGNELGSHSVTHPPEVDDPSVNIAFEFQQSKAIIEQHMSQILGQPFTVEGAAVPGNPEDLATALNILQYYNYLSGGSSTIGAGYPGAFGYITPAMASADKVYLAPNVSFDFSLVEFQGMTPAQASAKWAQEWNELTRHTDVPIILWPWHDYAAAAWSYDGVQPSLYTTQMFTDFISRAYNAGAEFVTLADLADRISSFDDSSLTWARTSTTITATVSSPDAGKLALDLDNLGTQKIASVNGWYAYDNDSVFLDRDGGSYTINLGATVADVTHITSLPMRAELVSLTGNGTNLSFSVIGEGRVIIDLAALAGRSAVVAGATTVSLAGEILTLDLGTVGTHNVSVTLSPAIGNHAPTITSNGGGATAAISIAENATAVATIVASDPDAGQSITYALAGGADAAKFSINAVTGAMAFIEAPNFEAATDAGANNVYDVIVSARDSAGASDVQAIAVAVSDVVGGTITGDNLANTLTGTAEADLISGLGGDDSLVGGADDDTLDGGTGADTMSGGTGNDQYFVDNVWDSVLEHANAGTDTIVSTINIRLGANIENGTLGAGAAVLMGNILDNVLTGNGADNVIDGTGGADTMIGGPGNDQYFVDNVWDSVLENANAGTDTIVSTINIRLGANIENGTLGAGAAVLTGNILDNVLTGNSADNVIDGAGGADTMIGGPGNDQYFVDNVWDSVLENANAGTDTIVSTINIRLGANIENGTLGAGAAVLTGNILDNVLTGNGADNVIDGAGGADTMIGGPGNDQYFVDNVWDSVLENANAGTDTIVSTINIRLGANIENGTLSGDSATTLTGNSLNNVLIGNGAANVLAGGPGNDALTGGPGADCFVFNSGLNAALNVDSITDFQSGSDKLLLSDVIFSNVPAGPLAPTNFVAAAGAIALDSDDFILYDTVTGQVSYDSDGSGALSAIHYTSLMNHPLLVASDLLLGTI
jgi:Ca2+-binding RTX toxin-like protein